VVPLNTGFLYRTWYKFVEKRALSRGRNLVERKLFRLTIW